MSNATHASHAGHNYLNHQKGVWSWLSSLDHKRICILYIFCILTMFLAGGIFAILVRLELLTPGLTLMGADTYNQVFTYHGTIMTFMVIIPLIPATLGNFLVPMMIGAKDVAFPRLNLASWYMYMAGVLIALTSLFLGGVDTGWTFYTPYSVRTSGAVIAVITGAFVMGFGNIFTSINFLVTIHKLRVPGMTWGKLPLYIWATYATSIVTLLATPVLAVTLMLLIFERLTNIGIFDPAIGGDPILFQHFFWFYSHPAVYIMVLPAMGVISEVIPVFSRKPLFGYTAMVLATFGIAVVAFVVWGHHMFVSGQSATANTLFSLITMFVAVPTGVKVFTWIATMYKGSIQLKAPMVYAMAFIFVFTIGGLTGVFLAAIASNVFLTDTYFVVAHFHYVMVGGAIFGFLAGIHYWFPKIFGKMYPEKSALISALLIFLGFNITFFPQFILGTQGMPRRYYDYLPEFTLLNQISTVGSWFITIGFLWTAYYLYKSLRKKEYDAPANPWNSLTLEWQTPSPPPHENFEHTPEVKTGPYDYKVEVR